MKIKDKTKSFLKYVGLAVAIVAANWAVGNFTVSTAAKAPPEALLVYGIAVGSIPLVLASRKRLRRYFVYYASILVAGWVFLIGKVNDIVTNLIPSLFGPDLTTGILLVAGFTLFLALLLWMIDYIKGWQKSLEKIVEKVDQTA